MRRLFLLFQLYITMELLICIDQNGLPLQIDKSYQIPNYNCTLNSSIEKLINMTSTNGLLNIIGTELLLTQNVYLNGFKNISITNLTFNTQAFILNSTSDIYLINTILQHNCQINANAIYIYQSQMKQITYQHEIVFKSLLFIETLTISDSTFFKSALSKQQSHINNLTIDQVSFINSTLGNITKLSNFTLKNSFIIQSILIETDISQQITIQNCYFTISTALITSSSLNIIIQNVTLSQSFLMQLNSSNQIIIKNSLFSQIKSNNPFIIANTQYISIQNTTIIQVDSTILQTQSISVFIYILNIDQFNGSLILSDNNININQFDIKNSIINNLIQTNGSLTLNQGQLQSCSGILLQSQQYKELIIDQINIFNVSNLLILSIQQSSQIQINNIIINNSNSIELFLIKNVIDIKVYNISIINCSECQIFKLDSTKIEIKQFVIQKINNFENILFNINESKMILNKINIDDINTNGKTIINLQNNKKILINDIILQNINCLYCDGVIIINNSQNINLTKSIFQNLITQQNGLLIEDSQNCIISNNTFQEIQIDSLIKISNTSVQIYQNQFININALQGIIIMDTLQQYYCDLNLYNNCTSLTGKQNYLITKQIVEPDILTYIQGPVYVLLNNYTFLLDDLIKKNKTIHFNTKSGQQINIQLAILDSANNKLCDLLEMNINDKIFQFNHINCVFDAYLQYYQLTSQNETVEQLLQFNELELYNNKFQLSVYLDLKECEIGEEFENQQCLKCPLGSYSLDNKSPCKQCRTQVETCPGGSQLVVKAGYWRPNVTTDEIEFCRTFTQNCLGGSEEFTCSQGQTGALCADCDYYGEHWNQSYTRGWSGNCTVCQNDAFNLVKLILSFIWILIALFFSVRGSLRLVRSQLTAHYLRIMGIFFATRSTIYIDQTEILIKLFSTYFQLVSIVLVIDFDFPTPLEFFAQIIGSPLSTLGFSIECFLLNSEFGIKIVYLRQFWNLFISCMIILLFVFGYLLFKKRENTTKTIFITCLIQVNFYFQGDIIEGLLQLMFCIKASGQYYIQAATQYLCYTDEYYFYLKILVIPVISLVGIISPIFYVVKLYRFKNKLWTCKLRIPYGYLYVEYKDKYYYWEFICFFVKSIFYLLETLLIQDIKLMFLFAIIVLLIYLELVIAHQPYIEKQYNFIDKISTQLAILTLIFSFCQDNNPYLWLVYTLSIICSMLNLIYCVYIIIKFIKEYTASLKQQHIEKIINLFIRYPCLKYCIKKPKNYQSKRKAGLLWRKVRIYVMEFIEKLKLQKSNNNIQSGRPNTSSTNTSIGLINSIAPQLLKYIKHDRNNSKVYDFQSVVSAYIDPAAESPQLPQKSTVSSIFHYVQQQL